MLNDEDEVGFELKQRNVRIPERYDRRIERLAGRAGMSPAQYCADVLMKHCDERTDELREIFRREAEAAQAELEELEASAAKAEAKNERSARASAKGRKRKEKPVPA